MGFCCVCLIDPTRYRMNNGNGLTLLPQCIAYQIMPGHFNPFPFNSLAPWGFDCRLRLENFKLISIINIVRIFCEIAMRWMPQHLIDYQSTLVKVMAWCRQATSHYLSQCWSRSLSPYDVARPQWVKSSEETQNLFAFCIISQRWDNAGS